MKNHLNTTPAYLAATQQAARLQNEMARLDAAIAAHHAADSQSANEPTGDARLIAGIAILDNIQNVDVQLAELHRKRAAVAAAITPAHREIERAERAASSAYYQTQATAVLAAVDGMIAALDSVVAAGAAFKAIRDDGARLGYNTLSSGLPIEADTRYIEWVNGVLPELRRDADRLRDTLDTSLDKGTLYIRALIDLPQHCLRVGDAGAVPTRQARTLMMDGQAEPSDVRNKLRKLVA